MHDPCPLHSRSCHHGCREPQFRLAKPDFRKFLAGAFFVSSGILFYLYLADVSVPLRGANFEMEQRDVRRWPVCDLPKCPREVGYRGRSGLVLLTQSLAGVDPTASAESSREKLASSQGSTPAGFFPGPIRERTSLGQELGQLVGRRAP